MVGLVDRSRGRPEGSHLSVGVGATPIPGFYTTLMVNHTNGNSYKFFVT